MMSEEVKTLALNSVLSGAFAAALVGGGFGLGQTS
jgi:hypothetical protein